MVLFSVESFFAIPRSVLIQMNLLLHDLDRIPFSHLAQQIQSIFHTVNYACFRIDTNLTVLESAEVDELIAESSLRSEFFFHVNVNSQWLSIPLTEDLFAQQLYELLGQSVRVDDTYPSQLQYSI